MGFYVFDVCKKQKEGEERFMFNEWQSQASRFIGLSGVFSIYFDVTVRLKIFIVEKIIQIIGMYIMTKV